MQTEKIQIKLFTRETAPLDSFVRVFHEWIRRGAIDDVMVDVADYSHVHQGPGILLTGHGTDYYLDESDGRQGLLFSRKRGAPPPADRLRDAFRRALQAAVLLEREPGLDCRFRTDELLIKIPDRLAARNDAATFDRLLPQFQGLLSAMLETTPFEVVPHGTAKQPFSVRVVAPDAPPATMLLERLE